MADKTVADLRDDTQQRPVPRWIARFLEGLARDRPEVLTEVEVVERLGLAGVLQRGPADNAIEWLRSNGWLVALPRRGTYAYVPPGATWELTTSIALRAWNALDGRFLLAGASAAWHLGYLARQPDGRAQVWIPKDVRLPDGLRPMVSTVSWEWSAAQISHAHPAPKMLARRRLDLLRWSGGLPAFGPEALIVQLAKRPTSFRPWADLIARLDLVVSDCDDQRLVSLLEGHTLSTWQRAAYLLHCGGHDSDGPGRAMALIGLKTDGPLNVVHLRGSGDASDAAIWLPQYGIADHLIFPLLHSGAKA